MTSRIAFTLAVALALAACGKKEDASKPASANLPAAATTPGTPPAGTAPGANTQPTSAEPTTDKPAAAGSVIPRNFALGTAIGPNKKVTVVTDTLTGKETAYASVDLYGVGEAKVRAVWNSKAKLVKSDTETVKVSAPITVEFHLSDPAGLAPGDYDVEMLVNEVSAGKMKFTVK
jgi:hypothetical protein